MTCFRTKTGETARQWCIKNNTSYCVVYKHLERGLTVEDACNIAFNRKGYPAGADPKYFYKGKPLTETIKCNSADYSRTIGRIRKGMPIDLAVELPLQKRGRKRKDNK